MRKRRLDEQPCHEAERTRSLRLLGLDRERLAEQFIGRTLVRDRGLRDSENGRSQRLEGGQLGEKRVRSWHQTGYQLSYNQLASFVASVPLEGQEASQRLSRPSRDVRHSRLSRPDEKQPPRVCEVAVEVTPVAEL